MVYFRGRRTSGYRRNSGYYYGRRDFTGYRRKRYGRPYVYRPLGGKLDRLSLQRNTIRIKYNFNLNFAFGASTAHSTVVLPVLVGVQTSGLVGSTTRMPPIVGLNTLYNSYAALYDEVQIAWVHLKSALFNYPTANVAARMHVILDRKVGGEEISQSTDFPYGGNLANNQAVVSRLLNSAQNSIFNYFSAAVTNEERNTWFDSDVGNRYYALAQSGSTASNAPYYGIKQDSGRGFLPAYVIDLEFPAAFTSATSVTVSLSIEVKYRFKSPKTNSTAGGGGLNPSIEDLDYTVVG